MAQRREIAAVYTAAVIQGIVLVTFPAVSAIFTSKGHYALSATQYGGMFIPQAVAAILASLLGAGLTHRIGAKHVFLIGLVADLISMGLLLTSQFAGNHAFIYGLLLAATGFLGIGFGFVVPVVNTFTAAFFPNKVDAAILTLNALLGLGTALAPIFAIIFVGFGFWWGLPILMSGLIMVLFVCSLPLGLGQEFERRTKPDKIRGNRNDDKMPRRFWIYAAFALTYGICETMNANWSAIYMSTDLGASTALAAAALTAFWISVTGGRILFAAIDKWCPPEWIYRGLPILLAVAFLATALTPTAGPFFALVLFGLAGLGCSALLPLVISFGQKELSSMSASVAGAMIGFYQMGYGIAAFGVGPVQAWTKLSLGSVYGWTTLFALGLAALAFIIVRRPASTQNLV